MPVTYAYNKRDLAGFKENYLPLFKEDSGQFEKIYLQGIADMSGSTLVPPKFDRVYVDQSGSGFITQKGYDYGVFNADGQEVLPAEYETVILQSKLNRYNFSTEFSFPILFPEDGSYKYVDESGGVLPVVVKEYTQFSNTRRW